ncbi:MAG TPA: UvrD-helicase domain-containing protein [Fimbriiglobus sp.]
MTEKEIERTPQQQAAIDCREASVSLAAGAGSGKTSTLTDRYLSHLDRDGVAVPQILAITFTERAARQMRKKVRAAIRARGPAGRSSLAHLDIAPIQTIHAFCASLLRRYAAEAGVDPAFEVLDDATVGAYRSDAVRTCLRRLVLDNPDTRDLVVLFGYSAVAATVEELLTDPDDAGWEKYRTIPPDEIARRWLGPLRNAVLPKWLDYLRTADPKIARFVSLLNAVEPTGPTARTTVAGLRSGLANLERASDLAAAIEELTEHAKAKNIPKQDWADKATYEIVRDAFAEFRGSFPGKLEVFALPADPAGVAEAAAVGQKLLRVALAAEDEFRRVKRSAAALDFADLIIRARDLVRDNPAVCGELHERYRVVLIDEFQDTDRVQYDLIQLLCGEEFLSGRTFAVGDEKQSIYRFRGAAVEFFRQFRQAVPAKGRLSLTTNFRSRPSILGFVNAAFGVWLPHYEKLEPFRSPVDLPGVEFLWSLPSEEEKNEVAEDRRRREAAAIARRILSLRDERGFLLKNFCLLFRSMSNVGIYEQALQSAGLDYYLVGGRAFFARQEVFDVVTVLRAVENPQDGESLVGVLRSPFFGMSDEGLTLVGTHPDGPWAGLHDPLRLDRLAQDDRFAAGRAQKLLGEWRERKDRLPVARLLLRMFADTGFDAATRFAPLPDRQLANLWKLVDIARDFDRRGLGVAEVVAHLTDRVAAAPKEEQAATTPEEDDVVRLMSVHQAKGMEYPVVFVPDLGADTRGEQYGAIRWDRSLGAIPKRPFDLKDGDPGNFSDYPHLLGRAADTIAAWEEDLRIYYVACTRAEELLILSSGFSSAVPTPENQLLFALDRAYDLATGACRIEGSPTVSVRLEMA